MSAWKLPPMVDPLGKYWQQPRNLRERVGLYFNHATIGAADWHALPNYTNTMPSGVYAGKVWRCGPFLRWYGPVIGDRCRCGQLRALIQ